MKFIKQFSIIILLSLIGELLKYLIPLPIPASIYGLLLMLIGLSTKLIPLEAVQDASLFLIDIMPLMFIPAGVGLLTSWGQLEPVFLPVILITVVSTVIVMAASGRATQFVIRLEKKKQNKENTHE